MADRSHDAAGHPGGGRLDRPACPLVCGALGPWRRSTLDGWLSRGDLQVLHRSHRSLLLATAGDGLHRRRGGWVWGRVAETGRVGDDWRDAADEHLMAGFWTSERADRVHTDGLGFQDLFLHEADGVVCFATRISLLTDVVPGRLHVDWDAWGSALAFCSPVGPDTGFVEIRRMTAGASWWVGDGAPASDLHVPAWLQETRRPARRREVLAAIADGIPRPRLRPVQLPLSGGWDSRALATLARTRAARRPVAWTIPPDDGADDAALSVPVARALGLRHHLVDPDEVGWASARRRTLARTEWETWLHGWLLPLAERCRRGAVVLDGLAGDVLLKNLYVTDRMLAQRGSDAAELMWNSLGGPRVHAGVARPLAEQWAASTRDAVGRVVERWQGHPAGLTLSVLTLRTFRAIALSPHRLFEPEARVVLPFVTPAVLSAALSVPLDRKQGGEYYRRLLHAADPSVAALPSTNDPGRSWVGAAARRLSAPALHDLTTAIRADPAVCELLDPGVSRALEDPSAVTAALGRATYPVLAWAAALADWRAHHRGVLDLEEIPLARV